MFVPKRDHWLFSVPREIVDLVAWVLPVYVVFHLFEAMCGACSGVLRGIGKQKFGAILNAVSYYGVGLPLAVVLLFVARIGVIGLWLSMLVCVSMLCTCFIVYISRMDWRKAAEEAQHRAGVTPLPPEEPHPGPEPPSKALPSGTGPTPPPHAHLPAAAVRGCVGTAEGWGCPRACGAHITLSDLRQNPQSPEALADPIPFLLQRGWKRRTAWCSQPSPGWREPPSSRSPRESHRAAPCPPRS
uniref:Solute carrier family 47 member 2 n=1 Tax=Anas platyrhynchos platyrhynchos TaxID=8840 RepID=A0A493TQM4_ANAPP